MSRNADPAELDKFSALAAEWWDPQGPMGPLHQINPLRLDFISRQVSLRGADGADVGCGGGILTEALARAGAGMTGIDLADEALQAAREHAAQAGLDIDYRLQSAEELAADASGRLDFITCMEMLEHVPDPEAIVQACAAALKPGGRLLLSTINRNPKAFAFAIVGAEHLLRLIPAGTHEYAKFIRPSELASWCRAAGLEIAATAGLSYNPLTRHYRLGDDVSVNYLMAARKHD